MENLAQRVRELIVASDSYRRTMAAALGISTADAAVLGQLLHDGATSPTVLAARAGLTPAAMTSLLDRLEEGRFVARSPHPGNRRRVLVDLTARGRAAITAQFRLFSDDLLLALRHADPRLEQDPALRRVITELLVAMAAALRSRAADTAGVRAAIEAEMSAAWGTADTEGE